MSWVPAFAGTNGSLRSVLRRNYPDVTRLCGRNARIARSGGVEIRPRLLAAFGTQRTDIGAIALGAHDRRAGADLR